MDIYKFKNKKAFSLIELLIVIAIIGILSTIILNSLSQSRSKAYDAQVKMQLRGFRGAAENYYTSQNPVTYGPATLKCDEYMFNDADPKNGSPTLYIEEGNLPNGTQVFCGSTDGVNSAYAVKATLYSGTEYWCVDSKGFSGSVSITSVPLVSSESCP
jgi:prepilin-type N-terminal cleavage/methylation domain-containing protein